MLAAVATATAVAAVALVVAPSAASGNGGAGRFSRSLSIYLPPVTPLYVVRGFDPPATRYGPGHLGVDLAVSPGAAVRAAGAGVVRFAGSVAGRGLVVLQHPDGLSTEYEPLQVTVRAGTVVRRGELLGTVAGRHGPCRPNRCLHWGARRGDTYLDPLTLLRPLGPVRLLPWRVSAARLR